MYIYVMLIYLLFKTFIKSLHLVRLVMLSVFPSKISKLSMSALSCKVKLHVTFAAYL